MMQDTKGTLRGQDSIVYTAAGLKIQLSAPLCSLKEIRRRLYASKWRGTPAKERLGKLPHPLPENIFILAALRQLSPIHNLRT